MRKITVLVATVAAAALAATLVGCASGASSSAASAESASSAAAASASAEASSAAAPASEAAASDAAAGYAVDYGTSNMYTQDDIDAAISTVMAEFNGWKGATMKSIAFTDDATCTDAVEYINGLKDDGAADFDEAIVIVSNFHSPSAEDAEGTAWEPDTDYDNYTWYLGRTKDGNWQLITWGY